MKLISVKKMMSTVLARGEFPNVGVPPVWAVDFCIELELGANPTLKALIV